MDLVILVGIQASGKTTFYRRRLAGEYLQVSLDNWRGRGNVRRKERQAVMEALAAAGESQGGIAGVVVDNTNITAETRRRYFQQAGQFARQSGRGVRMIAYFFDVDLKSCLERNARRPKAAPAGVPYYVPPAAIASFHRRLERPAFEEGFDKIFRVRIREDGEFLAVELPPARPRE